MAFMNALEKQYDSDYNVSMTENGALGFATTNKKILDMNFKVSSYRKASERDLIRDFADALNDNFELAVAWLFYARDVREGLGERRLFRSLFKYLADRDRELAKKLLAAIPEYGRWDDLIMLVDGPLHDDVIMIINKTLVNDKAECAAGRSISLLAKWLPSENTSSKITRNLAAIVRNGLGMTSREYRKTLSTLRAHIDVVERKMSANEWSEIDYEAVPSKANLIYKNAFLAHDEERRREFLGAIESGVAKINSSVNFPHEIVCKYGRYSRQPDQTLEALWKALPDCSLENTIVVADGSGSMYTRVDDKSAAQAIDVANALAIYAGEHCSGEFKNTYITFSSKPQLIRLKGQDLRSNLEIAYSHCEVANTNIKAVFELILRTAVNAKMAQEDIPQNILIISDMEFDAATYGFARVNAKLFETIAAQYAQYGYKLPKLIFWNVCSRTNTIPMKENENGVILVSGFSTNIMKLVMSNKLDPWAALVDVLTSERYAAILNAAREYRS